MAVLRIDIFRDGHLWTSTTDVGTTPSLLVAVADESRDVRRGQLVSAIRMETQAGAAGHRIRRSFAAQNLSPFSELRLWIRCSRASGGAHPQLFELRVGSAALAIDAPMNTWHRLLPVAKSNTWEPLRVTLEDLPTTVRSAMSSIQVRVLDGTTPVVLDLAGLAAVLPEMIVDVDAALYALLDRGVAIGGTPVPAVLAISGGAAPTNRPCILITMYDVRPARERTGPPVRCDYTATGYQIRPQSPCYDLYYAIEVLADDREEQAAILTFVLNALPPQDTLDVAAEVAPVEQLTPPPLERMGSSYSNQVILHYRVSSTLDRSSAQLVRPVRNVLLEVEHGGIA